MRESSWNSLIQIFVTNRFYKLNDSNNRFGTIYQQKHMDPTTKLINTTEILRNEFYDRSNTTNIWECC